MNDYIRLAIDKDLKEKVRQFAKKKGLGISAFIRMAVIREMEDSNDSNSSNV